MSTKRRRCFAASKKILRYINKKTTEETIKKNSKEELTTRDLNLWLARIPYFRGVYPCDKLIELDLVEKNLFIVNLDRSSEQGSHWIAIYLDSNAIEIFDSLGPKSIRNYNGFLSSFIRSQAKYRRILTSPSFQQKFDINCGLYAAFFVIYRQNCSFSECCSVFSSRLENNSAILNQFLCF